MSSKRYYWLKLKEDFFQDEAIEYLEEQENGAVYALFYLKLCLKSLKTDGILIRTVGDLIIPYNVEKLAEITKTPVDTVVVALELLKRIGLVQVMESGALFMTQIQLLTGSEAANAHAQRQKRYRERQKMISAGESVTNSDVTSVTQNVTQTSQPRDESIEYRDKSIEDRRPPYIPPINRNENVQLFARSNIQEYSDTLGEQIIKLEEEVGADRVRYAIMEAVRHGGRSLSYVETVARDNGPKRRPKAQTTVDEELPNVVI